MLPAEAGSFSGEPNERVFRASIISKVDPTAPTGVKVRTRLLHRQDREGVRLHQALLPIATGTGSSCRRLPFTVCSLVTGSSLRPRGGPTRVRSRESPVPAAIRRPSGRGRCRGQCRGLGGGAVHRPARARHVRPEDRLRTADRGPGRHARPATRVQLQGPVPRGHRPARRAADPEPLRRHGRVRGPRRRCPARPQPRVQPDRGDQGRRARRADLRPGRRRRHEHGGGEPAQRGDEGVRQPRRYGDQLLGRHHPVADLADL